MNWKQITAINLLLVTLVLSGCGGGGGGSEQPLPQPEPEVVTLDGTVAIGVALVGAEIKAYDADGEEIPQPIPVFTNGNGHYQLQFDGKVPAPLRLVASLAGNELETVVDSEVAERANINPVTNYVAGKTLAAAGGLSGVAAGDLRANGDEIVAKVFGDGVQFDAFASTPFVARTAADDFSTAASASDVLLDALAAEGAASGIEAVMATAEQQAQPLLEKKSFQLQVAKTAALLPSHSEKVSDLVESSNVAISQALETIQVVTQTVAAKAEAVQQEMADKKLSDEQQLAVVVGLVEVATKLLDTAESLLDAERAQNALDNTELAVKESLEQLVTNDEVVELDGEALLEVVNDVADKVVEVIEEQDIDLSQPNPLPLDIDEDLEQIISEPVVIAPQNRWDGSNWDTMVWQ